MGSTLLMQLLASSPQVALDRRYPIGEYRYLSYCVRVARHITTPFDPDTHSGVGETFFGANPIVGPLPFDPEALDRDVLQRRATAHLWEAMSEAMTERSPGVTLYAEKIAVRLSEVVEAAIPVRVVDCVRDPRDVLASIRSFTNRIGPVLFGRRRGEPEHEYLERFIDSAARGLDLIADVPVGVEQQIVRYEDFAVDLESTATRIGEWLGVTLDADIVHARRSQMAEHITTDSVQDSIGRWRTDLAPREAAAIWKALGDRLTALGYTE
ncbi:MAG: sulfotransferase [Acidimicrobiia bacterium]